MVEAFRTLKTVFSAHAEVVPSGTRVHSKCFRILRARGGSSISAGDDIEEVRYSPRTRR